MNVENDLNKLNVEDKTSESTFWINVSTMTTIRKWTWLSECSSLWSGAVRNHKWSCLSWCIDPLNSILLTLERHNNNMWFSFDHMLANETCHK
jgi:hypothetical protein